MPVSENIKPTNWEHFGTEKDDAWMPALSCEELEPVSQSTSGTYSTLTPQETEAVLTISAKRVSPVKQFQNGKYRKENKLKLAFAGNLPIVEACRNAVLIGIFVAPIAIYMNMNNFPHSHVTADNSNRVQSAPAAVRVARVKASAQHHGRSGSGSASYSNNAGATVAASSGATIDPDDALAGVPEYKGPSSVTGISLPHRHAYQTASIGAQTAQ